MGAREECFETDDAVPFWYRRLKTAPWFEVVVVFLRGREPGCRDFTVLDLVAGFSFSLVRKFFDTTGATSFRDFEEAVPAL
jgi:hypothetical protein